MLGWPGCLQDFQTGACVVPGPLTCESHRPSAALSLGCTAHIANSPLVHVSFAAFLCVSEQTGSCHVDKE